MQLPTLAHRLATEWSLKAWVQHEISQRQKPSMWPPPPILFVKESCCPHRKLQSAHMWVWNLNKYFVLETRCHRSTWRLLGSHDFSLPRYQGAQKARELWALLFSKLRNHMRNVAVIWASIFSGNNCSVRAELWKSAGPHNNIQANPNKENQIPFCFVHSWA